MSILNEPTDNSNVVYLRPQDRQTTPVITDSFPGPIELQMKAKLKGKLRSTYPDTFDWGVYDKIAAKFSEQPRGSVVFKTNLKLVNHHSSCQKCHYAFEIDAYGRGCFHECAYCYAKDQLTAHGFWNRPQPFPVDLAEVRNAFYQVFETDKPTKWRSVMEKRVPLRIGSMSDSFMWMDTKYGVTKELLKILNFYKYPYIIFTRSDLVAHPDYISLLEKGLCSVQLSISGNNRRLTRFIEPGAPSYVRRLKALKSLAEAGIWTTVRINPLFPTRPDGYFTSHEEVLKRFGSEAAIPDFPLFDDEFIPELAESKVPSILAGFVRLSSKAISNMTNATDIDMSQFFTPENLKSRGDKRYSDPEIKHYYRTLSESCKKNGVRFGTCYIGNGEKDYFQYQDYWSNKQDCCDALGNVPAFQTTSQSITFEERLKLAADKKLAASMLSEKTSFPTTEIKPETLH